MNDFLQRVENTVLRRRLLARGQKILAAISGGPDSMVLLHALHALAPKHRWHLSVAHFNHRLRGRASQADEKLVRQTAARLGLKFFSGAADVKKIAAQSKISVEMAARKLRHEFLARTARAQKIPRLALAHHADDQVELFFLRLLRGAGGEGLAGMKWQSPSPVDPTLSLVRPLLDFSKAELLAYARENKVAFRHDATNFSTGFLRNRIRNHLLPLLRRQYQSGLDQTVLRLMDIAGAEAEFVSAAAAGFRGRRRPFNGLPLAMQRKALQQQLTALGLMPDFELVEQLRETPGKPVSVCAGLFVTRDAAGHVRCHEASAREFNPDELALDLSGGQGRVEFGGRKFQWRAGPMKKFQLPPKKLAGAPSALREFFDADKVGGEIILRHWRPGDRFQPIGLTSAVKLQDLFVNAKTPPARRRQLVVATTSTGEIFWVESLRISERFKLTPATRQKLAWHLRQT